MKATGPVCCYYPPLDAVPAVVRVFTDVLGWKSITPLLHHNRDEGLANYMRTAAAEYVLCTE
jgi:hypothetical protein